MSRTSQQRIDDAVSQLVERLLPTFEGEEDAAADERYFKALDNTKDVIDNTNAPEVVHDEGHIAELIRRRFVRNRSAPDNALEFSNLYSRLTSRPVLSQKWAILYLLHQLSDPSVEQPHAGSPSPQLANHQNGTNPMRSPPPPSHQREARLLDDAFARPGLSTLPSPRQTESLRQDRPRISRPSEMPPRRRQEMANGDRDHLDPAQSGSATMHYSPSEASLLRDLPFTLQGVSSTNLTFSSNTTLKIPQTLPTPIIATLYALAEPSLLYKGLSAFGESSDGGLMAQSLRAAIGVEMRSYLGLVATLEGQIRRALAMLEESSGKQSLGKAGATLKRCVVWTREATLGLRLMSVIVDESKVKKGGQLISLIHSLASSHGDPFVGAFAERLLSHVTRPFYDMLRSWIYDGELSDPYLEFFVSEQHDDNDNNDGRGAATSVWEDKYKLDDATIPSIITEEFARKVFLIGKSLNFIRYGCGDSAWVEDYSKKASRELRYGDTASLSSSIDEAYKTTMARLIWLMDTKFKLLEHLTALKKYLLLGQGDFIALLMESLASNLDRPANSQYRHTLTAQLEHAIRNSNAQYDSPDVLRRLDARMLELSMGEIGWDVFTLEYKTDAPVDVIVTPHANVQYLKIFNFLWRVKRVEFALGVTWRRCMTGARGILSAVEEPSAGAHGKEKGKGSTAGDGTPSLAADWKQTRCAIAEMIHFIVQLQYYILFEVIESSWSALILDLQRPDATLDDLITAHAKYLRSITRKGLLSTSSSTGGINFTAQLHELLKIMLAYKDAVDGLYAFSVGEAARVSQMEARVEVRTRAGMWGVTERDDDLDAAARKNRYGGGSGEASLPPPLLVIDGESGGGNAEAKSDAKNTTTDSTLPALRARLSTLSTDFRARIGILLGDLAHQPDQDMRFLGVVMNFNEAYRVVSRRARRREGGETKAPVDKKDERKDEKGGEGKGAGANMRVEKSDERKDERRERDRGAGARTGRERDKDKGKEREGVDA